MIDTSRAILIGVTSLYNQIQERELVSPYYKGKQCGLGEALDLIERIIDAAEEEADD